MHPLRVELVGPASRLPLDSPGRKVIEVAMHYTRRRHAPVIAAGLRGGKGLPETVADHPGVFVTFTAPSFGPVHAQREHQGRALPCRPHGPLVRCRHGEPVGCWAKHEPDGPTLGTPLCRGCFDYDAAVLWNALAPELWRRTTIYLQRALVRRTGTAVRLAFAKVAEYQQRGAIHFHAVIRLDGAPPPDDPERG